MPTENQDSQAPAKIAAAGPVYFRGVAYPIELLQPYISKSQPPADAIISAFPMSLERGEARPVEEGSSAVIWDSLAQDELALAENEFQLLDGGLDDFSISQAVDCDMLTIKPTLEIRCRAQAYAAQLGEIRLLTSQCFTADMDGKKHFLVNTESAVEPVLYVEDAQDRNPLCLLIASCAQLSDG